MTESYVERAPIAELVGTVRTVWIQRTGGTAYVQRHLPTGGAELHFPIGGRPQLVGPLTGPNVEVIPRTRHSWECGSLHTVGVGPKALQRTLRFQGFLALAQAGATPSGRRGTDGMAGLAVDVGYADHAHLSRECVRLTGVSPRDLLGGSTDRCGCGHDHSASYKPFLATRGMPSLRP